LNAAARRLLFQFSYAIAVRWKNCIRCGPNATLGGNRMVKLSTILPAGRNRGLAQDLVKG
jgi:hypothetical protein